MFNKKTSVSGGFLNNIINRLPFEAHIPNYRFCGPGTKLEKRINQEGINRLDQACKQHDIAYASHRNSRKERQTADVILRRAALERLRSKDATLSEKAAAFVVEKAMGVKKKAGMGLNTSKCNKRAKKVKFSSLFQSVKKSVKSNGNNIGLAIKRARENIKTIGGKNNIIIPRSLPLPKKIGGFLIPTFASLSALGAMSGGISNIVKAVNQTKIAERELNEMKNHNRKMEKIAVGKGMYLKPFKRGFGLVVNGPKKVIKRLQQRRTNKKKNFKNKIAASRSF
ncbi:hypothetical protein TKK_0013892 [Trichogramma kaykai]